MSENLSAAEWQLFGKNFWVFGVKIRGIIRKPLAEVWWHKEEKKWVWSIRGRMLHPREADRTAAIEAVEKELGL